MEEEELEHHIKVIQAYINSRWAYDRSRKLLMEELKISGKMGDSEILKMAKRRLKSSRIGI